MAGRTSTLSGGLPGRQAASQAALSADGQSSTGRDRTGAARLSRSGVLAVRSSRARLPRRLVRIEPQMLSDDLAELPAGLDRFQATVEVDRGPDVSMPEEPSDGFVVARVVLQVDGCGRMSKLMDGDPQAGRLLNAFGNLDAEQMGSFDPPVVPGRASHHSLPEAGSGDTPGHIRRSGR